MKATLLLQARTSSSRLPAKALLPVEGVPLVVLAALRAGNTGHHVIVVTSSEPSDDVLCAVLERWGIDYFRGSLDNTLKRFVDALGTVLDEQVVVRLTGDNALPDGAFIDDLLEDFRGRSLEYLCCIGESSGLPYGVSAEVTRAGHLRYAHRQADTTFDREHVTPKVIERFGRTNFTRYAHLSMSSFRCTVDVLEDYLRLCRIFNGFAKPQEAPLHLLIERIRKVSPEVMVCKPASRMVLGTAQFGQNYGIANTTGKPSPEQASALIQTAIANGVHYLDTASAYGDSEKVVGRALLGGWGSRASVVTKISPLDDCPIDAPARVVGAFVEQSIYKSCHALRMTTLDVLMLHRARHLTDWQGAAWRKLCDLKQQKVIGSLGVSVQSPEEALSALDFEQVEFIQLPFNILDYRWGAVIERILKVRAFRPLTIHARSALLQGLLSTTKIELWHRAFCSNAAAVIEWLRATAQVYTSGNVVELSLRYVCSQPWIDGVVVGVETREQLVNNLVKMSYDQWSDGVVSSIAMDRPHVPLETLNPAIWEKQNV